MPARPVVVVRCSRDDDPGWAPRTAEAVAARLTGRHPDEVRLTHLCPRCGSDAHGRPLLVAGGRVLPVRPSLSRTRQLSVVAVALGARVGVDVEEVAATRFAGFAATCLHPGERAGTARERAVAWTRKESLLKACGTGLSVDPRALRLSGADQPPRLIEGPDLGVPPAHVWMRDLPVAEGYAGALTVLGEVEPDVRTETAAAAAPAPAATR